MFDYRNLDRLSPDQCQRRIEAAKNALGEGVLVRLLAVALFLLGASRRAISEGLRLPKPTLTSLTERVLRDGLPALEDRRCKSSTFLQHGPPASKLEPKLLIEPERLIVRLDDEVQIALSRQHRILCRAVLLTMLESGLLAADEVASALGLSTERVRQLRAKLIEGGVEALTDRRRGHQRDYMVTPEVKAELIQQYVLNLQTGASTSSQQLNNDLSERCDISLANRTVRQHVVKMGLRQIRHSLPELLAGAKKTPDPAGTGKRPPRADQE